MGLWRNFSRQIQFCHFTLLDDIRALCHPSFDTDGLVVEFETLNAPNEKKKKLTFYFNSMPCLNGNIFGCTFFQIQSVGG